MVNTLSNNWWAVALRGAFAVLFGILAFVWPGVTLTVLVYWFGAYVLVDGVLGIISAVWQRNTQERWWAVLLEGVVGVLAGLATFFMPGITALVVVYLISGWALVTGIFEVVAAIRLRKEIENEWTLALGGVLSIAFAVILFLWPAAGAFALVWMIAGYSVAFGFLLILLGFRLRTHRAIPAQTNTGYVQKQAR